MGLLYKATPSGRQITIQIHAKKKRSEYCTLFPNRLTEVSQKETGLVQSNMRVTH